MVSFKSCFELGNYQIVLRYDDYVLVFEIYKSIGVCGQGGLFFLFGIELDLSVILCIGG